ncbi:MAG: GAF domain-containing protein [Halofilum sp. (in: g-proteobacteria)]|nr:GAF domain-containing protein [Halofilum sp. (in: g-proteobacteria)]
MLAEATGEQDLLARLCFELSRVPGYLFAWVGYSSDDGEPVVRPVAASEPGETHFLPTMRTDTNGEEGEPGAIQLACDTREPSASFDLSAIDWLPALGDSAERRGCRSGVALPLCRDGRAFGVLCLAAGIHHAFDDRERYLLMKLADQVATGIVALRARDSGLLDPENLERLASIVAGTSDVIAFLDSDGNYLYLESRRSAARRERAGRAGRSPGTVRRSSRCRGAQAGRAIHSRGARDGKLARQHRRAHRWRYRCERLADPVRPPHARG